MAPLVNVSHLCDFYELNNLTTLNLKSVSFAGIENKFSKVIANNPNL